MKIFASSVCCFLVLCGVAGAGTSKADLQKQAKITMAQAEKIALDKEPGIVKEKELEREKGRVIYSFDVQAKDGIHEVNVDAITGEVVEDTVESAAAEAKEKQQDHKKH